MEKKRQFIRFQPDENTYMMVKIEDVEGDNIYSGLCVSESQGGCSAAFLNNKAFTAGKMCFVKVGKLDAESAEIRWVTELDEDLVKVGFRFLG
ncbi:MAG: hypothetical protein ACJAS4_000644 [Bacteriovoracaceae bacterium]|jgi:hypothetical protein